MKFIVVILSLLFASPAFAAPNAQLVRSVQAGLNELGFEYVDASTLSTAQIVALHLKLTDGAGPFGTRGIWLKNEIKVILGWQK